MAKRTVGIHEFVTGGGLAGDDLPPSWAAEGGAMRRALVEDFAALTGVSVTMTLDARLPDEPGPWRTVRVGPGEEPDVVSRLAAECDLTLCVAPETDRILEQRARWIDAAGGRSLGCTPEAIALCADKLRMAGHLESLGIAMPSTVRVVPREGLPRDFSYPAVLKPLDGAGSLDTYFVGSPNDLPDGAMAMPEAVLQPFVRGEPMSAAFLVAPHADPLLLGLADQHIERVGGRFAYAGGCVPSRVGTGRGGLIPARHAFGDGPLIAAARSVPGLVGWVGVDFLWDAAEGRIVVLEINPRVTTSYVGFRGVESPGLRHPSWIASLWIGRLASPRPGAANPWCRRVSAAVPVTFSADGRIRHEVVPS